MRVAARCIQKDGELLAKVNRDGKIFSSSMRRTRTLDLLSVIEAAGIRLPPNAEGSASSRHKDGEKSNQSAKIRILLFSESEAANQSPKIFLTFLLFLSGVWESDKKWKENFFLLRDRRGGRKPTEAGQGIDFSNLVPSAESDPH